MDKTELIKNFNNILSDFLEQISPLIGKTYHTKFCMIIKVNSIYPIKRFGHYAIDHETQIMNKNPEYFMDESIYKGEVEKNYGSESEKYMDKILQFKEIYLQVDTHSKENLWSILQALLLLSKEYQKYLK
jgi:hypothetical protein